MSFFPIIVHMTEVRLTSDSTDDAFLTIRRLSPQEGSPKPHTLGAEGYRLQNLGASSKAAVNVQLDLLRECGVLCMNCAERVESCTRSA
jgi:hypothetical protein